MLAWNTIETSEDYKALDPESQQKVKTGWFREAIEPSKEFAELSDDQRDTVRTNFFGMQEPEEPSRSSGDIIKDVGLTATKGVIGAGESVVGLADIPTFGLAGQLLEKVGYDPKAAKDIIDRAYSPAQRSAFHKVEKAEGFIDTLKEMVRNPSTIAHGALESAPSMIGAGAGARALAANIPRMATTGGRILGGAIGEGAFSAGQQAEQTRQETGELLTPKQVGSAVLSGIGTGAFALAGGRLAKKLGFADVDSMLAGAKTNVTDKGVIKRIVQGGISEGAFEELPQSVQEQIWQNAALNRPLLENADKAGAQGMVVGALMGSGANVAAGRKQSKQPPPPDHASILQEVQARYDAGQIKDEHLSILYQKGVLSEQDVNAIIQQAPIELTERAVEPAPVQMTPGQIKGAVFSELGRLLDQTRSGGEVEEVRGPFTTRSEGQIEDIATVPENTERVTFIPSTEVPATETPSMAPTNLERLRGILYGKQVRQREIPEVSTTGEQEAAPVEEKVEQPVQDATPNVAPATPKVAQQPLPERTTEAKEETRAEVTVKLDEPITVYGQSRETILVDKDTFTPIKIPVGTPTEKTKEPSEIKTRYDEYKQELGSRGLADVDPRSEEFKKLYSLHSEVGKDILGQYKQKHGETKAIVLTNKEGDRGVIVHPSTKSGKIQTTYWDKRGFSMDEQYDSMEQAIQEIGTTQSYRTPNPEAFDAISRSPEFIKGIEENERFQKEHWERMTKGAAGEGEGTPKTTQKATSAERIAEQERLYKAGFDSRYVQQIDGLTVAKGRLGAARTKWGVVGGGQWEDTPEEAVKSYRKDEQRVAEAKEQKEVSDAKLKEVLASTEAVSDRDGALITGDKEITTTRAIGWIADIAGITQREARMAINRISPTRETSGGATLYSSGQVIQKARELAQKAITPGRAWIKDAWRPFTEFKDHSRGKNKGKVSVKVFRKWKIIDRDQVKEWPTQKKAKEANLFGNIVAKETASGKNGNLLLRTSDGKVYESSDAIHAVMLDTFGLKAEDISETGIMTEDGALWSNKNLLKRLSVSPENKQKAINKKEGIKTSKAGTKAKRSPADATNIIDFIVLIGGVNPRDSSWGGALNDIRYKIVPVRDKMGNETGKIRKVPRFPQGFWRLNAKGFDEIAEAAAKYGWVDENLDTMEKEQALYDLLSGKIVGSKNKHTEIGSPEWVEAQVAREAEKWEQEETDSELEDRHGTSDVAELEQQRISEAKKETSVEEEAAREVVQEEGATDEERETILKDADNFDWATGEFKEEPTKEEPPKTQFTKESTELPPFGYVFVREQGKERPFHEWKELKMPMFDKPGQGRRFSITLVDGTKIVADERDIRSFPKVVTEERTLQPKTARELLQLPLDQQATPWGHDNVELRQKIFQEITGKTLPKNKVGVNAVRDVMLAKAGISREGKAPVEFEKELREWIKKRAEADRDTQTINLFGEPAKEEPKAEKEPPSKPKVPQEVSGELRVKFENAAGFPTTVRVYQAKFVDLPKKLQETVENEMKYAQRNNVKTDFEHWYNIKLGKKKATVFHRIDETGEVSEHITQNTPEEEFKRWLREDIDNPKYNDAAKALKERLTAEKEAEEKAQAEKTEKELAKAEKISQEWNAYKEEIDKINLPTGKKTTIQAKDKNGQPFALEGTQYGDLFIAKNVSPGTPRYGGGLATYKITHVPTGMLVDKVGSLNDAKLLIKAIIHSKARTNFTDQKDLNKKELDVWKDVINSVSKMVTPSYFMDIQAETKEKNTETGEALPDEFGEKIGGSRRDQWKERGLISSDLDRMTQQERETYATKANVWPNIDYQKLVDEGATPELAYVIKTIKDAVAITPKYSRVDTTPEQREAKQRRYVELVSTLKEELPKVTSLDDIKALRERLFPTVKTGQYSRQYTAQANSDLLLISGKNLHKAMQPGAWELTKITRKIKETGFPGKQEAWQKQYEVHEDKEKNEWFVTKSRRHIILETFPTKEEAEAWARDQVKAGGPTRLTRPYRENIERNGKDYRKGRNVTTDDILSTFGFRGGEFGNWTNETDRQQNLNEAYDALMDLAAVLDVDPKALSLNGELGLAFGARGSGWASAHYEPSRIVINLTKTRGAGALAHEWAHALDDYFGRQATKGQPGKYVSHGTQGEGVRKEVLDAWANVMKAINDRVADKETTVADAQKGLTQVTGYLNSWLKPVEKHLEGKTSNEANLARDLIAMLRDEKPKMNAKGEKIGAQEVAAYLVPAMKQIGYTVDGKSRDAIGANAWHIEGRKVRLARAEAGEITQTEKTDFLKAAMAMGKGKADNYWARKHELFARAFEAFVQDRLERNDQKSDYLVHSAKGDPSSAWGLIYPRGEDLKAINKTFDALWQTIDTKETDSGGVAFFQKLGPEVKDIFPSHPSREQIEQRLNPILNKLKGLPPVRVVDSWESLPNSIQKFYEKHIGKGTYAAMFVRFNNGRQAIYILADRQASTGTAVKSLWHEGGHFALRKTLISDSKQYHKFLDDLYISKFNGEIDTIGKAYGFDLETQGGRRKSADEWWAREVAAENFAQRSPLHQRMWDRFVTLVRNFFLRLGVNVPMGKAQIRDMMRRAWKEAERAEGPTAMSAGVSSDTMAQLAPTFYSQMQRTLDKKLPNAGTAQQFRAIIKSWADKGEFKNDEWKWSGVDDWLTERSNVNAKKIENRRALIKAHENNIKFLSDEDRIASERETIKHHEDAVKKLQTEASKITKQEVLNFLKANEVQIKEVTKGAQEKAKWTKVNNDRYDVDISEGEGFSVIRGQTENPKIWIAVGPDFNFEEEFDTKEEAMQFVENYTLRTRVKEHKLETDTKFSQWQLPGGENYRELLLTLPNVKESDVRKFYEDKYLNDKIWKGEIPESFRWEKLSSNQINTQYREYRKAKGIGEDYTSSHWSEPNVLAHVRFNDRTGPNGEKILFLEEVQSDWHQEGRRQGYQGDKETEYDTLAKEERELEKKLDEIAKKSREKLIEDGIKSGLTRERVEILIGKFGRADLAYGADNQEEWKPVASRLHDVRSRMATLESSQRDLPPKAPFAKTWHELALKRMLRYAAENGYDRVAWTTGEQQAERYDLSKYVDQIVATREDDGSYYILALDDNGKELINQHSSAEKLPDLVGKDLADKIIAQGPGQRNYSGLDLKVGGEGMKGFYDKIIPDFLNKYAKKWGSKVSPTRINTSDLQDSANVVIIPTDKTTDFPSSLPFIKKSNGFVNIELKSGWDKAIKIKGSTGTTDTFSDFLSWQSSKEKSFSKLPVPIRIAVLDRVSLMFKDSEIADAVVRLIPVDVMNHLTTPELSTNMILHNPTVLSDRFVPDTDGSIPFSVSKAIDAIISDPAFPITEVVFGSSDVSRWPANFRPTKSTKDFHGFTSEDIVTSISRMAKVSQGESVWSLPVTESMRESVLLQGQAMFQKILPSDVNTPEFKKWFGDWEEARKYKRIINIKPIEISDKSVTEQDAYKIYSTIKNVTNEQDSRQIFFVNSVFGKLARHKESDLIFRAIPKLGEVVKKAEPIYSEAQRFPEKHNNVIAYHNYLSKVSIDGTKYFVRTTVQEVKKPEANELHNLFLSDIQIEKAGVESNLSGLTAPYGAPMIRSLSSLDKKLASWLSKVKADFDSSSKVVDVNGKPLVVYHGTGTPISKFKFQGGNDVVNGFWFTESSSDASIYAEMPAAGDTPNVTPVYVRIENPTTLKYAHELAQKYDNDPTETTKALQVEGYDGIIDIDPVSYKKTVVAFSPTQIKSIFNRGTWDKTVADISGQLTSDDEAMKFIDKIVSAHQAESDVTNAKAIKKAYTRSPKSMMKPYEKPDGKYDGVRFYKDTGIVIEGGDSRDLNRWIRRLQTKQDQARNYPEMRRLLDVQLKGQGATNAMSIEDRKITEPYYGLKPKARDKVDGALFYGDEVRHNLSNETLEKKFGLDEDERKGYWSLRKFYDAKRDLMGEFWLEHMLTPKEIQEVLKDSGMTEFKGVVKAAIHAINTRNTGMVRNENKAKTQEKLRKELTRLGFGIGHIDRIAGEGGLADHLLRLRGYVPHQWDSEWRVYAEDRQGAKYLFDLPDLKIKRHLTAKMREAAAKKFAEDVLKKELGGDVGRIWVGQYKNLPVDLFEDVGFAKMNGIVNSAVDNIAGQVKEELGEDVSQQTIAQITDKIQGAINEMWLAKGAGRHLIGRQGVLGYKKTNLAQITGEYATGVNAWYNKAIKAKEFAEAMKDINPRRTPEMWRDATEYISDMLGESAEAGWFKRIAGIYYLAGDISAATLNMTQNWTHAVALLRKIKPTTDKMTSEREVAAAMKDVMKEYLSKRWTEGGMFRGKSKYIEPEAVAAMEDAFAQGLLDPQFFGETTGFHENKVYQSYVRNLMEIPFKLFTGSEAWNRMSTFLAAYRRAKRAGMEDPGRVASQLVNDAHFIYGKGNRPEIVRKAGAFGNVAFTYMTYPINNLVFLKHRVEDLMAAASPEERKTALKVIGSNLAYLFAFGGLNALPFAYLAKFIQKLFDDPEDDWEKWLYEQLEKPEFLPDSMKQAMARTITKGLPAALGNDLSWRVQGTDVLGAPIGLQTAKQLFYYKPRTAYQHLKRGEPWHTVFFMLPDMFMNPYKAFFVEGGTGIEGKPPIKYTPDEQVLKAMGFTPTRESEARKIQEIVRAKREDRLMKLETFAERYIKAVKEKDTKALADLISDVKKYNLKEMKKGREGVPLQWNKDIVASAKRRFKGREKPYMERGPKYMRGYQEEVSRAFE